MRSFCMQGGGGVKKAKKLRVHYMDGPLAVLHTYKIDFWKLKSTDHNLIQKEFPSHSNPFNSKCKDNPASKVETLDAGLKRKPIVRL